MGNLLKYSGIVTKIRAMEAKLLTPEQFADIANLRSVPDIADYLRKNTAYAEVLDTLTEDQIHRGNIEKVLTFPETICRFPICSDTGIFLSLT